MRDFHLARSLTAAVLLLAGCTQPPAEDAARPSPTNSASALPSPSLSPSPAADVSPCSSVTDDRPCLSMEADLDGDGKPDVATLAQDGSTEKSSITVQPGNGSGSVTQVIDPALEPQILGAVDADGQAGAELFVEIDHGASTVMAAIFAMAAGRITRVEKGRAPLVLSLSGSVRHGNGAECRRLGSSRSPGLALLSVAVDADGKVAEWGEEDYLWNKKSLKLFAKNSGKFDASDESRLSPFYRLRCGTLDLSF